MQLKEEKELLVAPEQTHQLYQQQAILNPEKYKLTSLETFAANEPYPSSNL